MSALEVLSNLHRAEQAATSAWSVAADKADIGDLTIRQAVLLQALSDVICDGRQPSQTELVDATGIDRSTLADIVSRLLKRGLIERKRTKEDARAYALRLTKDGNSVVAKIRKIAADTEREIERSISGIDSISVINASEMIAADKKRPATMKRGSGARS